MRHIAPKRVTFSLNREQFALQDIRPLPYFFRENSSLQLWASGALCLIKNCEQDEARVHGDKHFFPSYLWITAGLKGRSSEKVRLIEIPGIQGKLSFAPKVAIYDFQFVPGDGKNARKREFSERDIFPDKRLEEWFM